MVPNDIKTLHDLPKKSYLDYIRLFPITQSPQAKDYTTLLLTTAAIILFSVFAIAPTINTILELRKTLEDREFALATLDEKLTALDMLQQEYNAMGNTLDRINMAIPNQPDVPSLFARVQTLAIENNVDIVDLASSDVALDQQGKIDTMPTAFEFTITFIAPYDRTITFLNALTSFDRIVTIDTISMQKESESTSTIETTVNAKAYFHPEVTPSLPSL